LFTFKKDLITISKNTISYFNGSPNISGTYMKLYYHPHTRQMLGIRISKKALPLAVSRNSLRRKLRETFREHTFINNPYAVLLSISSKIQAEKKDINDILLPEWKSLLDQLR
jgi:ribonuclease P protein component